MTFARMTREQASKLSVAEQYEWFQQRRSRRRFYRRTPDQTRPGR